MYKLIPALSGAYVRLEKPSTGPIRVGRAKRAFRVSCVKGVKLVMRLIHVIREKRGVYVVRAVRVKCDVCAITWCTPNKCCTCYVCYTRYACQAFY